MKKLNEKLNMATTHLIDRACCVPSTEYAMHAKDHPDQFHMDTRSLQAAGTTLWLLA